MEEQNVLVRFQSKLVQEWTSKFEAAKEAKKAFSTVADQCMHFYAKDCGFMWEPTFKRRYMGNIDSPKFKVTINKAFEFVTIYGPYLYWRNPQRAVRPYEPIDFDAEQFAEDPQMGQFYMQLQAEQDQQHAVSTLRSKLMERYLNYTPREQACKLAFHSEMAINEALLKGRGCLWVESYSFPGSDRTLTGCFYDSVNNLLIDPDCNDPLLKSAKWIARRHCWPTWEVERKFGLPEGSLKRFATLSSSSNNSKKKTDDDLKMSDKQTHDLIVWYEVWSKGGVGTRFPGVTSQFHDAFEEIVGDFAYMAIAPSVTWLLNAPPPEFEQWEDDDVMEAFAWPFPSHIDDRWPVALLDFHHDPNGCWPIAPLGAALGELICLNVLTSAMIEQAWDNRKSIIAYLESASDEVEEVFKSQGSPAFLKLRDSVHKSVNEVIQYLNRPEMNGDLLKAIEYVSMLFDKRTGLTDFMYAMSASQSRSARDVAAKEEKSGIRPDKMAKDVAAWQTTLAELEKLLAAFEVGGEDIAPHMGQVAATLWDQLIGQEDPELVAREMSCTIEASDVRKPNKEREAANLQQLAGFLVPMLQQYATITSQSGPLNAFFESLGESMEQSTSEWQMGPWVPPPPDEIMAQMQQQQAAVEMEKTKAEAEQKRADAVAKLASAQSQQADGQTRQLEFQFKNAEHMQEVAHKHHKFQQEQLQAAASFLQKGQMLREEHELKQIMKAEGL